MADFFANQRIIVTGGDGFLGRVLVNKLREHRCRDVFVPLIEKYDLTREENVINMYQDFTADIVIHLAAIVGGIGANREHPASFFYNNLMMGAMVMEYARQFCVKKFVTIGTICAYPKFTPVPFREEDLWIGYPEETNAPYGLAKKMLLVQAQAYRQEYDFNAIYLLPVNMYGPGDNFNPASSHVIPALIKKFVEAKENRDEEVVVWGDGSASREFLYVEDAADAIILATKYYNNPAPVNLGVGREITIKKLAQTISELVGFQGKIVWDRTKPNGQPRRCLDVSKAEQYFGFKARMDFEEGLQQTIDWYIQNKESSTL